MTEHSKIPLPEQGQGQDSGKSLFERAEELRGETRLAPAPMPAALADPVNRSAPPRATRPEASKPAPAAAGSSHEGPAVRFGGEAHPLDRDRLARHGLLQPEAPVTGLLEEFRIVKRGVLDTLRKAQADHASPQAAALAQRVLICSPLPGEGKTFCAANLALALATEKDIEVLLVDADLARPSIPSVFGLPAGPGLMDVLADPAMRLEDCVQSTDISDLYVLPAGHHSHADSEYLSSHRTDEVLDALTRGAPNRVVIFDSPPALAASPAAELAGHVGQAIVVVRADRTGESALEDALTLLAACPDIKLLLNAAHFSPSGRRFGAYYGQGD